MHAARKIRIGMIWSAARKFLQNISVCMLLFWISWRSYRLVTDDWDVSEDSEYVLCIEWN